MKTAGKLFIVFSIVLFVFSISSLVSALEPNVSVKKEADLSPRGAFEDIPSNEAFADSISDDGQDAYGAYKYILKVENGKVMLYAAGSGLSPQELNISYLDLPPEDRALLDSGIAIKNDQQLLSVIEDYTN